MAKSSKRNPTREEWNEPYPNFPLSYHPPSGRLYKSIRSQRFYFGYHDDWQAAVDKFDRERDALYAGREPTQPTNGQAGGPTVKDLLNKFRETKLVELEEGEICQRTFDDYQRICDIIFETFDKNRLLEDLRPDDFRRLRKKLTKGCGPTARASYLTRLRVPFNFALKEEMVSRALAFGTAFKLPSKKVLRKHRAKNGKKLFEREQIHALLNAAKPTMRAMIWLGINCGLGNSDVGQLRRKHIKNGWLSYPRPKTGVDRRAWLWPETREALEEAAKHRPKAKDASDGELVFLTAKGRPWHKDKAQSPLSAEFKKLAESVGVHRAGIGFYALRHTYRTVADECRDFPAIDMTMGHARDDMGSVYRERISDDRLRAVSEHVREWLLGGVDSHSPVCDNANDASTT